MYMYRLTPATDDVPAHACVLREDGDEQQHVKIESLDEDPRVVGCSGVVEQYHHRATLPHLHTQRQRETERERELPVFIS